MKVYITKYALTQGILEQEAVLRGESNTTIVVPSTYYPATYHKPYWYTDKEDAIKHAESMRIKKIASLKRSLNKYEKLKFE